MSKKQYTPYEAYTNYITFAVSQIADNDEDLYNKKTWHFAKMSKRKQKYDAQDAKRLFVRILGIDKNHPEVKHPDCNFHGGRWTDVNWREIAKDLNGETAEFLEYDGRHIFQTEEERKRMIEFYSK